jgi:small subunit ribosomal protein S1
MNPNLMEKLENPEEASESWEDLFEAALDSFDYENPVRGQILEGEIIQIDEDSVLVDIGAKRDAIVPRKDLDRLDEELRDSISQGDQVPVYVMRTAKIGGDLLVSINRGMEQEDWERAAKMLDSGEVLHLPVIGQNRGGLVVRFGRLRGFVPNSHIPDLRRDGSGDLLKQQKENMIGGDLVVKVLEVNQKRRRLVLSSRAARRERRLLRLKELHVDSTLTGTVVNLVDFGAFVDLGGVDGLVHISELDWSRVEHPSEVLEVGQELDVRVLDVDVDRERISLSRKALLPNPWEDIMSGYAVGDLVGGEITNVRDFGAFMMLPEGVEGLIHVSEIGIVGPGNPEDVVHPGDKVLARILDIESERERISLSLSRVSKEEQLAWLEGQPGDDAPEGEADAEPPADSMVEDFDAALEEAHAARPDAMPDAEQTVDASVDEVEEAAQDGPEAVADAEPEAAADAEPEAVADAEPEAAADAEPEAVADTEPEAVADTEPEAVADAEPEAVADAEPEAVADAEPEAVADAEPEAEPNEAPEEDA